MGFCGKVVVHCMDFRIQAAVNEWLDAQGFFGDCDRVAFAGPCRHKKVLLEQIEIAYKKHGVRRVILMQHEDCAAYGGQAGFRSPEEEQARLTGDMASVRNAIVGRFPKAVVERFLVRRDGGGWCVVAVT